MTSEDIIRMAREAFGAPYSSYLEKRRWDINDKQVERFAALVAAAAHERRAFELAECYRCGWDSGANAERVECARVCIEVGATKASSDDGLDIADFCAAAIQARGAK